MLKKLILQVKRKKTQKICAVLLASAGIVLILSLSAFIYARTNPAFFVTNRTGRAIGRRLMNIEPVRSYVEDRADRFITPRTTAKLWRHSGIEERFDIVTFRGHLLRETEKLEWDSLSPERKREHFTRLLNPRDAKMAVAVLMGIPEDYRREIVFVTSKMVKDYRQNMSVSDERELSNFINSPEGRAMLEQSQRYYINSLTPQEVKAIGPVVDEIVKTVIKVIK